MLEYASLKNKITDPKKKSDNLISLELDIQFFFLRSIFEITKQVQDVYFKYTNFYWNIFDLW